MAKGKTNQPLKILVIGTDLLMHAAIRKLEDQGHTVHLAHETLEGYDRVFGQACYRMTPALLPFLSQSLKDARVEKKIKTPPKPKKGDV